MLRLLLLALMGLALASRLALGATLPAPGTGNADPLAKLQAAIILCQTGHDHAPAPAAPKGPRLSDLLLFGQGDNAHALASLPPAAWPLARRWYAAAFLAVRTATRPPLWRAVQPARGPPPAI